MTQEVLVPCLPLSTRVAVPLAAVAALTVCGSASAQQSRITLVYDSSDAVQRLVSPSGGHGLTPARGALRQDPGGGGMLAPGDNAPYRVSKVSGATIAGLSPAGIAATLRQEIRAGRYGARSHLVTVDEIGSAFGDPLPRVMRVGAALPAVPATNPGSKFTAAMRMLQDQSPYGGTWASRVHVYLAPAVHTSIAAGRGPERNLGRDGKPHRRSWRALMPGLAMAGGVHLEMYHGLGGQLTALSAGQWRAIPAAFLGLFNRYGGSASTVHFMFTATDVPAGATGCGSGTACSWTLAESTPAGRTVLANGPGVHRIGTAADAWMREFNRRFT